MSEGLECSICFTDYEFKDLFFVDACGHMFCNGCMEENVKAKLVEGQTMIKCPANKCPYDLGYYEIKHLLRNDQESIDKYERFLYEHTIDELDDVIWCPQAHCVSAVPIHPESSKAKCLNCNFKFCIKCREEIHENTCEWNKKWKGKIDSFDAWKEAHGDKLKVCPGCDNLCEKISGCSTVPCCKCKTVFCWLCCEKLGTNSNHFNVPRGCKNTYNPNEKPPTESPVDEESEEEEEDESVSGSNDGEIEAHLSAPPLPEPDVNNDPWSTVQEQDVDNDQWSTVPDTNADDDSLLPILEPDELSVDKASMPSLETYHSWRSESDQSGPIDPTGVVSFGMPFFSKLFGVPLSGHRYSNVPVKASAFSNDDYVDDDDFEETLKKLSVDNPTDNPTDNPADEPAEE